MIVLALDTCFQSCSVAVTTAAGTVLASESAPMVTGQAEALIPMLARQLDAAHIAASDLGSIIATTGPGSFTGARIGVAAARGLSLATGAPALGMSSLRLIAMAALDAVPEAELAVAAMDARGGHLYLEIVGRNGQSLTGPRLVTVNEAARVVTETGNHLSANHLVVCGAAAPGLVEAMGAARCRLTIDRSHDGQPSAAALAAWVGLVLSEAQPAAPVYLRPPDAKPQDGKSLARAS